MDRLKLTLAACGLAALLFAPGCRNLRPEVPPGPPYSSDGRQMPPVGFSSDPHAMTGGVAPGGMAAAAGTPGNSAGQLGIPAPGSANHYGAPTNNAYGAPGTSAMAPGGLPAPPSQEGDPLSPPSSMPAAPAMPGVGGPGMMGGAPGPR